MHRVTVGDVEIIGLSDGTAPVPGNRLFPDNGRQLRAAYGELLDAEGNLLITFGCFLLRADGRTVLVDTGNGPERGGPLMDEIATTGIGVEEIEIGRAHG